MARFGSGRQLVIGLEVQIHALSVLRAQQREGVDREAARALHLSPFLASFGKSVIYLLMTVNIAAVALQARLVAEQLVSVIATDKGNS